MHRSSHFQFPDGANPSSIVVWWLVRSGRSSTLRGSFRGGGGVGTIGPEPELPLLAKSWRSNVIAKNASKEQLDRTHEMGQRVGAAGGPKNAPHSTSPFSQDLARKKQENDAYRRGHATGEKNRKK